MKKIFLGSIALMALVAGPAFAADMAVKAPVYVAPAFSWTGLPPSKPAASLLQR